MINGLPIGEPPGGQPGGPLRRLWVVALRGAALPLLLGLGLVMLVGAPAEAEEAPPAAPAPAEGDDADALDADDAYASDAGDADAGDADAGDAAVGAAIEAAAAEAARAVDAAPPADAAPEGDRISAPAYESYEGIDMLGYAIRTVAMLGALCAMAFIVVRLVGPRVGPGARRAGDVIVVHEIKRIDPKTQLLLVEVAGRHMLIGVSDREVRCLTGAELDDQAIRAALVEKAPQARGPRTFASYLRPRRPPAETAGERSERTT